MTSVRRTARTPGPGSGLMARMLVVLAATGTVVVLAAPAALAHVELARSDPASGSIVSALPASITLHLSEPVTHRFGSIAVTAPSGAAVPTGPVTYRASAVSVSLAAAQGKAVAGTYVVSWRVVSDDNHPVGGTFAFSVQSVSTPASEAAGAALHPPQSTKVLLGLGRLVGYLGLVLLIGAVVFVAFAWSAGAIDPRLRRIAWTGWTAVVVGALTTLLMQGPDAAAVGPLSALTEPRLLMDVMAGRYGQLHVARVAALLAVTPGVALAWAARARVSRGAFAGVAGGVSFLAATWSLGGHAGVRSPVVLSVAVDVAHLVAVSAWLGGLVVVLVALLRSPDLSLAAPRWSALAFGSVVVLTATGTWASVAEVGSWRALVDTDYGRLLLGKIGLVTVMVVLGAAGRRWVRRGEAAHIKRTVRLEAALGAGVLVLASLLVASAPGRSALSPPPVSHPATSTR